MELKIFDSILFENLRPWLISTADNKTMNDALKKVANNTPKTLNENVQYVLNILNAKSPLAKWLKEQKHQSDENLVELYYEAELPDFTDVSTKYYATLIEKEVARVFTSFLTEAKSWADNVLANYHTELALRKLKHLIKTASKEISNQGFEEAAESKMLLVHFVMLYLKRSLIAVYFSIQEHQREVLENQISLNDFYLLELQQSIDQVSPLKTNTKQIKVAANNKGISKKLTFDFRGDKPKLKAIIARLCDEINLLDENQSPADELFTLLTAKDIKPGKIKIYIGCDNKNFRYFIEKLIPQFDNLTFINIQHSESFYTKKGKLINSNDFSKAKSFTPKQKEIIDNIFNQLQ